MKGKIKNVFRFIARGFRKDYFTKSIHSFVYFLVVVIILLLVFKGGMIVGYKKAKFSYQWKENYQVK